MQNVLREYSVRWEEVRLYLGALKAMHNDEECIERFLGRRKTKHEKVLNVMRANTILLLYKLVESTIVNLVTAVYDNISYDGISFDQLKRDIRVVVLKNAKRKKPSDLEGQLGNMAFDIISKSFERDEVCNGNVDARMIRDLFSRYGVNYQLNYRLQACSDRLLTIKNKRNDLAHGIISFSDCGRLMSINDITRYCYEVDRYLRIVIGHVEQYIHNREYQRT